ncbi:hypothetical protein CEXT_261121 [Caerostris extrusa]|uniref:Suppressor of white apricot N-terminal domain-containing protein n=1 Tax=Caerostris extrusa TaxID=172846 RepID=A0AAV4U0D3_CAEEX|nr:hypothetical protein CEXT_261121 [Caerostris extrusa]
MEDQTSKLDGNIWMELLAPSSVQFLNQYDHTIYLLSRLFEGGAIAHWLTLCSNLFDNLYFVELLGCEAAGTVLNNRQRCGMKRVNKKKRFVKQDPAQFLQVHGRPAKIHLDPAVAIVADSAATMMPWQGQADNLIDRFDVRAHLDIIPEYDPSSLKKKMKSQNQKIVNRVMKVSEEKFLNQIFLEERFGICNKPEEEKKKPSDKKAAIGYVYEDSTDSPPHLNILKDGEGDEDENDEEKEEDLSDIDLDVTVDVKMLTPAQCAEMNAHSHKYGMVDEDFITYLHHDKAEAEKLKAAREIEEEKAMYSGRKSRRERRALRKKKLAGRKITSPPSYAARDSPTYTPMRHSTSKSRSDGEQLGKSRSLSTNSKTEKNSKTKDNSDSVIGPQLPSKNGDDEKSTRMSRRSSYSDKRKHDKHHRGRARRRSRHSSRSSSGRSVTPKKSSSCDKKKSRRTSRSRSRSISVSKSRSRSRSCHQSHHNIEKPRSQSRSRSKSVSNVNDKKSDSPQLPPPPVKSYYRHSLSRSSSELSEESEEDNSPNQSPPLSNLSSSSRLQPLMGKAAPATKVNKIDSQERLKRKMQIALRKQYKADKLAQMEKTEKQLQEKTAEELREMAIKLRQREREKRHKLRGYGNDSDSDSTWTKNPDSNIQIPDVKRNSPTSSRSNSSYSSPEHSPPPVASSNKHRSRSKTPPRSSRRSPVDERRRSPYRRRSPMDRRRRSPYRRRSPARYSPRRSPHRSYRRSPTHSSRNQSCSHKYSPRRSPRRYSPTKSSRRYSPSKNDSRRNDSRRYEDNTSRHHRQGNHSPSRKSRSPSKSYGTKPLVDY